MRIRRLLPALVLTLLGLGIGAADIRADDFSGTYAFAPDKPRYPTTVVVVRNERKLRPLFLSGRGERQFQFNAARPGRSGGEFALIGSRYSVGGADYERMAGTAWLTQSERPPLALVVNQIERWRQDPDHETRAIVHVRGAIHVGDHRVGVNGPAQVTFRFRGKEQGPEAPKRMDISARFEVAGRDLGLTGDDAGPITIEFHGAGYTQEE
ncbi:MAG: hypothetical protein WD534_02385 [Phycisphaeraceae bacterium]